jgi:anti-sigma factor ChrR (cupin superfamily)
MHSLEGPERFAPFFAALSRLFDLPVAAIEALLARIDDARAWEASVPGVKLIDFTGGPRVAGADAGLVRLAPGAGFPRHRHLGHETTIVLEGTLIDGGRAYEPGAVVEHVVDSVHKCFAGPDRDLVTAVLHHGLAPAD